MDNKKKKALIIALAACLVVAIACAIGAVVIKKTSAPAKPGAKLEFVTLPDGTNVTKIKKEYEKLESSSVKGAPDTYIKAAFLKKVRDAAEKDGNDVKIVKFELIKTYDAFRMYDVEGISGKDDVKTIICIYSDNNRAIIGMSDEYKTSSERADLITKFIKYLDDHYEELVKNANKDDIDEGYILY